MIRTKRLTREAGKGEKIFVCMKLLNETYPTVQRRHIKIIIVHDLTA